MAKHRRKQHDCPNCGTPLAPAFEFCPTCGQENHELKVPFGHMVYELVEGLTHFDAKVWATLRAMAMPGRITQKFLVGKRARYVPPVRLYIFVSIVFFFVLNALMDRRMREDHGIRSDASDSTPARVQEEAVQDSVHATVQRNDSAREEEDAGFSLIYTLSDADKTTFLERPGEPTNAELDSLLVAMGNPEPNWFRRRFLVAMLHVPTGEQALDYITHLITRSLSLLLFVLMPFFALLLKVLFARKRLYYEHLIFSIHTHTAFLLLFSLVSALGLVLPDGAQAWMVRLTWTGAIIYLLLAFHRVYRKRWWATGLLTGMVLVPYFFAFVVLAVAGILFGFLLH